MPVPEEALDELTALAGVVLVATDLSDTLSEICRIATRAVPNAEGASVTTLGEGTPSAVASDSWSKDLDEMQFAEHEGPCLDAFRTGNVFRVRDFNSDTRWPSYSMRALERGAISMISLPLSAQGTVVGALNLYARQPDAFDAEAASVAQVVSAHVGLASQVSAAFFRHRDLAEQLAEAMRSRAVIEQAKGVVMAKQQCDADAAFAFLRSESQNSNRKLRDVAADVVALATEGD
jgi:transcriptional regulator with GAF, ATPase, and Fis domain